MDYPYEIKANVETSAIDDALAALDLDDGDAESRSIYFWETRPEDPGPSLYDQDVVLRLRRGTDSADCTLKLRPVDLSTLPDRWHEASDGDDWEYRIELDWAAADPVLSASLSVEIDPGTADAVAQRGDPSEAFSTNQRELFDDYSGHALDPSRLRLLGPVRARKWDGVDLGARRIDCEEWIIGDDIRFLELSDREKDPDEATETRRHLLDLYADRGLHISTSPELKTKVVLDHFFATADS